MNSTHTYLIYIYNIYILHPHLYTAWTNNNLCSLPLITCPVSLSLCLSLSLSFFVSFFCSLSLSFFAVVIFYLSIFPSMSLFLHSSVTYLSPFPFVYLPLSLPIPAPAPSTIRAVQNMKPHMHYCTNEKYTKITFTTVHPEMST